MGVTLTKIVEKMELRNLTPDVDMTQREVKIPDINRPALQLAGFFDHFDCERIQLIGYVEYTYLQTLEYEHKMKIYDTLLEYGIPCFIFCRNLQPDPEFLEKAVKNNIPVFITDKQTSSFSAELIRWMKVELAPCISIHGVLVDCYGVGVLIMGDSGIGKSEAALELIKRGHRLVSDDVVEIRRVSDDTLVGSAPDITRHFIELRGIGIIDVKTLFGVESVREIPLNGAIEYADTFLLTMAMTALGTETSIDKFRQAGAKPFVLAGLLYVWLVAGGYFVTKYLVGIL